MARRSGPSGTMAVGGREITLRSWRGDFTKPNIRVLGEWEATADMPPDEQEFLTKALGDLESGAVKLLGIEYGLAGITKYLIMGEAYLVGLQVGEPMPGFRSVTVTLQGARFQLEDQPCP